jgi:uncharacterized coiled-coil DUF342 family protein
VILKFKNQRFMNRKIFAVFGMSLALSLASARAAENAGGNAENGKPTDREIRGAIRTFEQQRDRFLNTQRELTREAASATAERRAQIREELNRAKQELEKIRREARESAQNAREQAREQGRRVSDAVREQTGGGRDR